MTTLKTFCMDILHIMMDVVAKVPRLCKNLYSMWVIENYHNEIAGNHVTNVGKN